jgi:hypothetical protein
LTTARAAPPDPSTSARPRSSYSRITTQELAEAVHIRVVPYEPVTDPLQSVDRTNGAGVARDLVEVLDDGLLVRHRDVGTKTAESADTAHRRAELLGRNRPRQVDPVHAQVAERGGMYRRRKGVFERPSQHADEVGSHARPQHSSAW